MFESLNRNIGKNICVQYWQDGEAKVTAGKLTEFHKDGFKYITLNDETIIDFFGNNCIIMNIVDDEDTFLYRVSEIDDEFQYIYHRYTPDEMSDDTQYLMSAGLKEICIDLTPEWIEFVNQHQNDPKIVQATLSMLRKLNAGMKPMQVEFLVYGKEYDFKTSDEITAVDTNVCDFLNDQDEYINYIKTIYQQVNGSFETPKRLVLQFNDSINPGAYQTDRFKKRK